MTVHEHSLGFSPTTPEVPSSVPALWRVLGGGGLQVLADDLVVDGLRRRKTWSRLADCVALVAARD